MESLRVVLDVEASGFANGAKHGVRIQKDEIVIGGMPSGTQSGKPTVLIGFREGPNFFVGETTLSLFLTAADALKAKYGDPRQS